MVIDISRIKKSGGCPLCDREGFKRVAQHVSMVHGQERLDEIDDLMSDIRAYKRRLNGHI